MTKQEYALLSEEELAKQLNQYFPDFAWETCHTEGFSNEAATFVDDEKLVILRVSEHFLRFPHEKRFITRLSKYAQGSTLDVTLFYDEDDTIESSAAAYSEYIKQCCGVLED